MGLDRITALRTQRGWTVRQLAQQAGTDVSGTSRRETGKTDDLVYLRKLAKAFGVKVSTLLNDEDVELRADDDTRAFFAAVQGIAPQERTAVLTMAVKLVRIARVQAAQHSAAALGGKRDQIEELADMWARANDDGRDHLLELMRVGSRA